MARQSGTTRAEAADRLDHAVHQLLLALRRRKRARLPGLGLLIRGRDGKIALRREGTRRA